MNLARFLSVSLPMPARHAVLLTPLESALPRWLLSYKQIATVSPLESALSRRSQLTENTATLSSLESSLREAPVSAENKRLTASDLVTQTLYNQRLRKLPVCVGNKGLITPLQSALTKIVPASSLESALPKNWGWGVRVTILRPLTALIVTRRPSCSRILAVPTALPLAGFAVRHPWGDL
jgi:hypothetical protein